MLTLDFHPTGRHFLQIPGPSPVPDRILRAMSLPTIDHRGPEFGVLGMRVLKGIAQVFQTKHPVVIYPASGTGAWEAALVNTLSPGDAVLMVRTGWFATLWQEMAKKLGASHVVDFRAVNPVEEIMRLTDGRGVAVAIEALGTQSTFESALRVLRPGGTLSSLGVYSTDLTIPLAAFGAGLAVLKIVTTLCPGGKERMRRLMEVIASGRVDLTSMVTHRFKLDDIEAAYDLFGHQRDGVLKVAIAA